MVSNEIQVTISNSISLHEGKAEGDTEFSSWYLDSNKGVMVLHHEKCNQVESSWDRQQDMELECVPTVITRYTEK